MRFIKENPALAAGIGLPFLLVILFSLAGVITEWTVAPPQNDMFFTVQDSQQCANGNGKASFYFADGKVKARYMYPKIENNYVNCYDNQRLYRFDAKNMTSREIAYAFPPKKDDVTEWRDFEIPELQNLHVDNRQISPDGYRFERRNGYYRGGFFPFDGAYSNNDNTVLVKNGRVINISPIDSNRYYYVSTANFLGWIVK